MSVAIILAGDQTDSISQFVKNIICTTVGATDKTYEVFNVEDLEFKYCTHKSCEEIEFDKTVRYGCKKFISCIDKYNQETIDPFYSQLKTYDTYVFLVKNGSRKLKTLIEELSKKEEDYRKLLRSKLFHLPREAHISGKMYLLVLLPEKNYSFDLREMSTELHNMLYRKLKMEEVDSFVFDERNGNYMMEILPFAIRQLMTNLEIIERNFVGQKTSITFKGMMDLPFEILQCLDRAEIYTVGSLSIKTGEEIFEILGQVYYRVLELYLAYLKNDIPSYLLNDLISVAENYKNQVLTECKDQLKEIEDSLLALKEKFRE